ncbi:Phage integrase [Plesiocystis pacifica SIR-1]|uniref:Phage integrase n=2 Tax=Plesiocystis pacifica TaxID=191768 RepID=A6FXR9_9BACT|nr:Phage integrase [Plesiocystis pacifica SIR-1]
MIDVCIKLPDGRTKRVRKVSPVQTKRAAQAFERETRAELMAGLFDEENNHGPNGSGRRKAKPQAVPTLAEFAPEFMAYQATLNKATELASKRSSLKNHLLPVFGDLRLDQIDARAIDRYKMRKLSPEHAATVASTRRRAGEGLKPKTINNHLMVLSRALRVAQKWGVLDRVPEIELLRVTKQPFDFLDFEEAERYLAAAREHYPDWHVFVLVAARTGLRVGELLALQWKHVRLAGRTLRVELSYTRAGGVSSPKSGKAREVPLTWDVARALEVHREVLGAKARARDALVFPNADGERGSLRSVGHFVSRIAKAAKLRHVHPHMLRHTFASHAVMRGVPMRVVQEWLGHASIEMTMRYAHLAEGIGLDLIDRIAPERDLEADTDPDRNEGRKGPASTPVRSPHGTIAAPPRGGIENRRPRDP